ncbi:MAG: helix-turn-helix transcriptional regulator [Bilophila sp.]
MKNYPYLLESLGIAVEKVRKERKMTKTALASFSDLQDCYIRGIIKGKRNPTITAIYSICEALDIPPLEFFQRVTDEMETLRNRTAKERPEPVHVNAVFQRPAFPKDNGV